VPAYCRGTSTWCMQWHSLVIALPDFLVVPHLSITSNPPLLEINCLVLGELRGHIFPVEIAATKTVRALKDAIKEKSSILSNMSTLMPLFSGGYPSLTTKISLRLSETSLMKNHYRPFIYCQKSSLICLRKGIYISL
jgi:hypothetical protein